jgi:hypothetical protein
MHPTPLLPGGGEHLAQRPPQPQRPVAHHHHRRAHAAAAAVPQQLRPRIGRLALAVGDRDQLLGAVGAHPHQHQAAQPPVLQADVEVDAVRPAVHVVPVRQVPAQERLPLGLPLDGQPGHHRGRQARAGAKERLQRRHEVQAGQPVQVQQRQHLGHLGATPAPARQDHAVELLTLARGRVGAPVVHPRADHLHLACPRGDGACRGVPVADHQPAAALVHFLTVGGQVGLHLRLQRDRQHPAGTLAEQLVQAGGQLGPCLLVNHYTQHRGVPSSPAFARRRPPYRSGWKVRRVLMRGAHPQISTIALRAICVTLPRTACLSRSGVP